MSASFKKNRIAICSPIEGYNIASIMKNDIVVGENLIENSIDFEGWSIGNGWIFSTDSEGFGNYHYSRTGATANTWYRLIPQVKINPHDYKDGITVSFDIKTPDKDAINSKIIAALQTYEASGNRLGWYEVGCDMSKVINNEWCRIEQFFAYNALAIRTDGTKTVAYTQFSFQLVQNGDITIRKIKAEKGNKATIWTPSPQDGLGDVIVTYTNPIQCNEIYEI